MVSEHFNANNRCKPIEKEVVAAFPLSPDSSLTCPHAVSQSLHKCRSDSVLTDFTWVSMPSPTTPYHEGLSDHEDQKKKNSSSLSKLLDTLSQLLSFISILVPVFGVILIFVLGKSYVKLCVIWLDGQDPWLVFLVFTLLYVAVSFPVVWGYIVLNIGCGYHFGFIQGLMVTVIAVFTGLAMAHISMKSCCSRPIRSHLSKVKVISSMIEDQDWLMKSSQAFKVIIVSRLSPIPFGLQNAAFAVSCIGLPSYLTASILGLLPTQLINIYIGTTLRSMEEFLTDESTAAMGYGILLIQILGSVTLMACIVRRAKRELKKTVRKKSVQEKNPIFLKEYTATPNNEANKGTIVKSSSQIIFSPQRNLFRVAIAS